MSLEQHAISQYRLAAAESPQPLWDGPLFIIGMPRSGTKLLRGLLNRHPRIRILQAETDFLPFVDEWVTQNGAPETAEQFEQLHYAMQGANYFNFRAAERGPFDWRTWRSACNGRCDASGLFEGFVRYELDARRGDGVIWADKSPAYIRHVPLLLRHFPNARIVHIVRDVRDHCVSMRNAWHKDIRRAAWRWGKDVFEAHRQCVARPGRCLEMKFERLLQQPERELRRICLFLDIEFFAGLTELSQSVEGRGYAAGRTEIVRDNFSKFSTRLTRGEIATIESLAWKTMLTLGYVPQQARGPKGLSPVMLRMLRLKDGMQLAMNGVSRRGIVAAVRYHATHHRMSG